MYEIIMGDLPGPAGTCDGVKLAPDRHIPVSA